MKNAVRQCEVVDRAEFIRFLPNSARAQSRASMDSFGPFEVLHRAPARAEFFFRQYF
jgi:hypothetical protein